MKKTQLFGSFAEKPYFCHQKMTKSIIKWLTLKKF